MTDEQIIKALDCCHSELGNMCSICPLFDPDNDYCEDELHKNALNLINRQKVEIERLNIEFQSMRSAANSYKMHYEKAQAEIEKLTLEIEEANEADRESEIQVLKESKENAKLFCEAISYIKSEAVKEFVDRLKEKLNNLEYHENSDRKTVTKAKLYNVVNWIMREVVPDEIDNLAKEMTEVKENEK